MDAIQLVDSARTLDGLGDMMEVADDARESVQGWVDVATALLIVEVAKRAEDKKDWFPRGKWATIQSIQRKVDRELEKIFKER